MPKHRSDGDDPNECLWAYLLNFGGGLLQGDYIDLEVKVGPGCSLVLASQGSTKIFKTNRAGYGDDCLANSLAGADGASGGGRVAPAMATQVLRCVVEQGALLAVMPQPLTCFAGARYAQRQCFDLAGDGSSSLLLVDWVTSGRMARGEEWAFKELSSCNQVRIGGRLVFLDALMLANEDRNSDSADSLEEKASSSSSTPTGLTVKQRMGSCVVFGFVLMVGPALEAAAHRVRESSMKRAVFTEHHSQSAHSSKVANNSAAASSSNSEGGQQHAKRQRFDDSSNEERKEGQSSSPLVLSSLCSASDIWVMGGDENTRRTALAGGGGSAGMILRFAAETTEEAHNTLLDVLAPLRNRLGRLPFGPVAV
mmetsp:Transcript_19097/g.32400  ORF Transcript_19097/g.32400 Transcript_19097/m.32400 type:complete len:367 (-) Transcript_19097:184-1284(-)